jgi:hypothetical protein
VEYLGILHRKMALAVKVLTFSEVQRDFDALPV